MQAIVPPGQLPELSDYRLILPMRADLAAQIRSLQQSCAQRYKAAAAFQLPAEITLLRFRQYPTFEKRISQLLRQSLRQQVPIMTELTGLGAHPTHSLFIPLGPSSQLQQLVRSLKTALQGLLRPDKSHPPFLMDRPELVIARKLKPWQFDQCWPELEHRGFRERFIATHICLRKKAAYGGGELQIGQFEFEGLPVGNRQAQLF